MADQDCVKLDWGHHVLLTLYQVIYICNCSLNYRIQRQSRGFLVAHYERLVNVWQRKLVKEPYLVH